MNTDLELTLQHLKALVACDTSNPPRKINQSGLIEYLSSLDCLAPQITDLGEGSMNILLAKGSQNILSTCIWIQFQQAMVGNLTHMT